MKNSLNILLAGAFVALTGCAPVKFYSDPGLTQKTGLKYYTVKPYLLVERDPLTSNILKADVIYIPDLENPMYMVVKDGPGSRTLDLTLENGSISTIGIASDAKISETIEALGSLVSNTNGLLTDLSALKGPPQDAAAVLTELYEIIISGGITSVRKIEIR